MAASRSTASLSGAALKEGHLVAQGLAGCPDNYPIPWRTREKLEQEWPRIIILAGTTYFAVAYNDYDKPEIPKCNAMNQQEEGGLRIGFGKIQIKKCETYNASH
jgi:hypothetical protein